MSILSFTDIILRVLFFVRNSFSAVKTVSFLTKIDPPLSGTRSKMKNRTQSQVSIVFLSIDGQFKTSVIGLCTFLLWLSSHYLWLVNAEGSESWITKHGLFLNISVMSIPCLSPHAPQGLAPNTRYPMDDNRFIL